MRSFHAVRAAPWARRHLARIATALALAVGLSSTTYGQIRLAGESDADWTVLTIAPDGAWGAATDGYVNQAIADAVRRCREMSGRRIGCGAYLVSVQHSWALGRRCGDVNILSTGRTLAEAVENARERAEELRRTSRGEMPACRTVVTVTPDGSTTAPPPKTMVSGAGFRH